MFEIHSCHISCFINVKPGRTSTENHYNLWMHLAAIIFGDVGSISCILNQNEYRKNFTCTFHVHMMWQNVTPWCTAQSVKMGQYVYFFFCCIFTAILWTKKLVAPANKQLHPLVWSLFHFLADVHAVWLLLQQPFIFDVWFAVCVLRQTSNTLLM